MRDLPIACELTPAEMEARRQSLLAGLLAQAQERLALTNGFRWRFAPGSELLAGVVKAIDLERQCCRFLHFVLTVEPDAGPIWLEVTGPQGTAEFLEALSRNGMLSFGAPESSVHYTERPAAYIVIVADSKVAM